MEYAYVIEVGCQPRHVGASGSRDIAIILKDNSSRHLDYDYYAVAEEAIAELEEKGIYSFGDITIYTLEAFRANQAQAAKEGWELPDPESV